MSIFTRTQVSAAASVFTAAALALTGCAAGTTSTTDDKKSGLPQLLQNAVSSGTLTVGTSVNAPIAYLTSGSDQLSGVTADVMREYLKRSGVADKVSLKVETMDFSSLIPALQTKRIDYMIDTMYVTEARKKVVDFTDPIFYNPEGLVVPKGNPDKLASLADLCGKSAGSYDGSAFVGMLKAASEKCGSNPMALTTYPKVEDVINDISAGRLDGGLIDATVAAYGIHVNPSLTIELVSDYVPVDKSLTAAPNAVLPGNEDFVSDYNKHLEAMKADGTMAKILDDNGLSPADYFLKP
ncbi:substrate-binding periplasmic protein [Arthrobacter sp. MW3 TE3886]|uniref:substrate-binding periplasmic protein n=1 Tax=Arthrobacter sp. MW3 TE3886 TaxID=3156254 RepID=UPI003511BF4C